MSGCVERDLSKFIWQTRYRDPGALPPESDIAARGDGGAERGGGRARSCGMVRAVLGDSARLLLPPGRAHTGGRRHRASGDVAQLLCHGLDGEGIAHDFQVTDHAYAAWRQRSAGQADLPGYLLDREAISPRDHLLMQAALQPFVDGAISKTVALSRHLDKVTATEIFQTAYDLGLKKCTAFRESVRPGVIADRYLTDPNRDAVRSSAHCCDTDRESD